MRRVAWRFASMETYQAWLSTRTGRAPARVAKKADLEGAGANRRIKIKERPLDVMLKPPARLPIRVED